MAPILQALFFNLIFLYENWSVSIQISLEYVPKDPTDV